MAMCFENESARQNWETEFSALKRVSGERLRSRLSDAQYVCVEAGLKVLLYNKFPDV